MKKSKKWKEVIACDVSPVAIFLKTILIKGHRLSHVSISNLFMFFIIQHKSVSLASDICWRLEHSFYFSIFILLIINSLPSQLHLETSQLFQWQRAIVTKENWLQNGEGSNIYRVDYIIEWALSRWWYDKTGSFHGFKIRHQMTWISSNFSSF